MPYSGFVFDQEVRDFLAKNSFNNYLDIGCGAGKYGKFIKELVPQAHVHGIEVCARYIEEFSLHSIYNVITQQNINEFIRSNLEYTTDIVIIGDCIEHLWKSDGLNLINFLVYRCKYMILIFPSELVQFSELGEKHENHISVWSEHDFTPFRYQYSKKGCMNLCVLEGYL